MKRLIAFAVLAALLSVCLQSAFAAKPAFPPGLQVAMEKTAAAFQRQIDRLTAKHNEAVAELEALIQEALLAGDLEAAAALQEELDQENAHFGQKLAKLQAKLLDKQAKFQAKIGAWIAKHGGSEEEPGDDGDIPPPPESPEQPQ